MPKTVVETRFDEVCGWPYYQPYGEYQVTTIVKRKYKEETTRMQIQIDARRAITATTQAIAEAEASREQYRATLIHERLHDLMERATGNGHIVDSSTMNEMEQIIRRDVDAEVERHPAASVIATLQDMLALAEYALIDNRIGPVMIDDSDWQLLGKYL